MKAKLGQFFESIAWLVATIFKVMARRPAPFAAAATLILLHRVVQFLVMVLPLKVILLAADSGVPKYMPFIGHGHKTYWIFGLTVGTILAFVLSQALGAFINRVCERAGTQIMTESAELSVIPRQREQATASFETLATILAESVFWLIGMALLALIAQLTFAVYLVMVLFVLGLAVIFSVSPETGALAGARRFVVEKTPDLLNLSKSIIFLAGFASLLFPFFARWDVNMLSAIVAVMLIRRTLSVLSDVIQDSLRMIGKRRLVDTLMFREKQFSARQDPGQKTLSELFTNVRRRKLASEMLGSKHPDKHILSVTWRDPVFAGVSLFAVQCDDGTNYQLQVYSRRRAHSLDNEGALFSVVDRPLLMAPQVIAEATLGDFACRMVEAADGDVVPAEVWRENYLSYRAAVLAVRPPQDLIDVYCSTHQLPQQKLTEELVKRMKVALSTDSEKKSLRRFIGELPQIRGRLDGLPMAISNRDINRRTSLRNGVSAPLFTAWGRWSVGPLGGGLLADLGPEQLRTVLAYIRSARSDIGPDVAEDDVRLAGQVERLIEKIERGAYAAAIQIVHSIQNPALAEILDPDADADELEAADTASAA